MMRNLTLLTILVLLAGCGRAPAPAVAPIGPGRVVLGIFSGRPDPTWAISVPDIEALQGMIAGLKAGGPIEESPGLGYRGFVVAWTGAEPSQSVEIEAFQGMVAVHSAGATRSYADPSRSVERWLLEKGRPHLEASLYNEVLEELGK